MTGALDLAQQVLDACRQRELTVATAESCTGGMVAARLTDIAGCSEVFDRGFVTYSNASKIEMLGVVEETLAKFGAVSEQTALEMVAGALARSTADLAVAITGIAGPAGGSPGKPVGLVWFAIGQRGQTFRALERRFGDMGRAAVRKEACQVALELLLEAASQEPVSNRTRASSP